MLIMARYFFALAQLLVQYSPWQNVKPLGHHLHEYRRWYNVVYRSGCSGNALYEFLNDLEAIKNRPISISSCWSFWWTLWQWNDASVTAGHHAWEFFNSLHVLLVLVNSRPANCDSLMELGQSSTSAYYSRFPEACSRRRSSVSPCISECYFWSFRGLSLSFANNSRVHLRWQLLQRILLVETGTQWWLGLCVPKFVSALRTSKICTLLFAQVVNEFDDSPSSISLYLQLFRLRWHCCRNKSYTSHCRGNVCLPSVRVCTPRTPSLRSFLSASVIE